MNTHDKYELPPLPEHDMCGEAYAYSNDAMQDYARAAIEADRKRQGEVVVTKTPEGEIIAVTRQDDEGKILSVIAEADRQRRGEPYAQLIVVDEDDEWPQLVYLKGVNLEPGVHDLFLSPQPAEPTPTQKRHARLRSDPVKAAALDRAHERIAVELSRPAEPAIKDSLTVAESMIDAARAAKGEA